MGKIKVRRRTDPKGRFAKTFTAVLTAAMTLISIGATTVATNLTSVPHLIGGGVAVVLGVLLAFAYVGLQILD